MWEDGQFDKRGQIDEGGWCEGLLRIAEKQKARISASLCFVWCRHQESNPGPTDYKSVALPTELYRRVRATIIAIGGRL